MGTVVVRSAQKRSSLAYRPDIQLKLPLHRTTVDTGYDQGYGSERSPEDEMPPPLLLMHEAQYNEILASSGLNQLPPASVIEPNDLQRFWNYEKAAASLIASGEYGFITKGREEMETYLMNHVLYVVMMLRKRNEEKPALRW
ncbi:hypothetical protein RP20_CCG014207 [Aedes albopictus]|nr:hypothetical protein RP20_CCG014207 [Aedes albopictus]